MGRTCDRLRAGFKDSTIPEGIDASDLKKVPEQYVRVDAQTDRPEERTAVLEGYGLSTAKTVEEAEADPRSDAE